MAENMSVDTIKKIAKAYGLSNNSTERPHPVEYASGQERQRFFTLFCYKQNPDRVNNIKNASALVALETVTEPTDVRDLLVAGIDAHQDLEQLALDRAEGRAPRLTKASYDKYVGALERAAAEPEEMGREMTGRLATYAENILADGEVIVEYHLDLSEEQPPATEQMQTITIHDRNSKPQNRIFGRIANWLGGAA